MSFLLMWLEIASQEFRLNQKSKRFYKFLKRNERAVLQR